MLFLWVRIIQKQGRWKQVFLIIVLAIENVSNLRRPFCV